MSHYLTTDSFFLKLVCLNLELHVNIKEGKSSIRCERDVSKFNPVERKVAWQADPDDDNTLPDYDNESPAARNDIKAKERIQDSFKPPLFNTEDSGSEYDTDIETESSGTLPNIFQLIADEIKASMNNVLLLIS